MNTVETDQADVAAQLAHASSYSDGTTSVEMIETHISWVFLTNRYAYKLKKSVHLQFLDFSTPKFLEYGARRWDLSSFAMRLCVVAHGIRI